VGVGVLLAGAGVFYNYVILVPHARNEARQILDQCLSAVDVDYSTNWNRACEAQVEQNSKAYKMCLLMSSPTQMCKQLYGDTPVKDCKLPSEMAASVEESRKTAKEDCYKKSEL
jgi:hypothetical protein